MLKCQSKTEDSLQERVLGVELQSLGLAVSAVAVFQPQGYISDSHLPPLAEGKQSASWLFTFSQGSSEDRPLSSAEEFRTTLAYIKHLAMSVWIEDVRRIWLYWLRVFGMQVGP